MTPDSPSTTLGVLSSRYAPPELVSLPDSVTLVIGVGKRSSSAMSRNFIWSITPPTVSSDRNSGGSSRSQRWDLSSNGLGMADSDRATCAVARQTLPSMPSWRQGLPALVFPTPKGSPDVPQESSSRQDEVHDHDAPVRPAGEDHYRPAR